MIVHPQYSESDIGLENHSSFIVNFPLDLTLDASNLTSEIRLGQSEIGCNLSLDADI